MAYPIPSKNMMDAMEAHKHLNIFAAVEALLTGGTISGDNPAAKTIIAICRAEIQRQLKLTDKAVAAANKENKP